jgi:hypothetical protein
MTLLSMPQFSSIGFLPFAIKLPFDYTWSTCKVLQTLARNSIAFMSNSHLVTKPSSDVGRNETVGYSILGTGVMLFLVSLLVGWSFWLNWFSKTDSLACSICIGVGVAVALVRGFRCDPVYNRTLIPFIFLGLAFLVLFYSVVAGRPKMSCIAAGLSVAGLLAYTLRSESVFQALSIGIAFMVPSLVDACEQRGAFEAIESAAVGLTSGIAEANSQFHMRVNNTIEFGHGVADQFSSVGRWDSILPFLGIALCCIYALRRSFAPGLLLIVFAFLVWLAVRATAWVAFSWYAEKYEIWPEWGWGTQLILFGIGSIMIVGIDQFLGSIFEPIPTEFINGEAPLMAVLWNGFVSLPGASLEFPQRELDFEDN